MRPSTQKVSLRIIEIGVYEERIRVGPEQILTEVPDVGAVFIREITCLQLQAILFGV
jgi:hypothetical protein